MEARRCTLARYCESYGTSQDRRVYVAGMRLHHGTAGIVAIASYPLLRNRALVIAGTLALAHDRRDFPFRDHNNH